MHTSFGSFGLCVVPEMQKVLGVTSVLVGRHGSFKIVQIAGHAISEFRVGWKLLCFLSTIIRLPKNGP